MTIQSMAAYALGLLLALLVPVVPQIAAGATIAVADADATPPFPTEPAPAPPALVNPVTGFLESGRLIVSLSTTRRYADGPSVNYG